MKIGAAVNLALEWIIQAQKLQILASQALARGDDHLNEEEVSQIRSDRSAAFKRLDESIERAENEGR